LLPGGTGSGRDDRVTHFTFTFTRTQVERLLTALAADAESLEADAQSVGARSLRGIAAENDSLAAYIRDAVWAQREPVA
jgi:hypothetical protein